MKQINDLKSQNFELTPIKKQESIPSIFDHESQKKKKDGSFIMASKMETDTLEVGGDTHQYLQRKQTDIGSDRLSDTSTLSKPVRRICRGHDEDGHGHVHKAATFIPGRKK